MTEKLLEVHEAEILRLKNSCERYKDVYEKLARRQKLWEEYLDLEVVLLCAVHCDLAVYLSLRMGF